MHKKQLKPIEKSGKIDKTNIFSLPCYNYLRGRRINLNAEKAKRQSDDAINQALITLDFKSKEVEGFHAQYELLPLFPAHIQTQEMDEAQSQIEYAQKQLDLLQKEEDRLTCHADGWDYALAVASGVLTGMIDVLYVGSWNFDRGKATANREINERIIGFAKKDPRFNEWAKDRDPNRLETSVAFLEKYYKLPGDGTYQKHQKEYGINSLNHHLADFCHHPTPLGLLCCLLVQFNGQTIYLSSSGDFKPLDCRPNEYGIFWGNSLPAKFFCGIVNWFLNIAGTIRNRKGHLYSDMAGSISTVSGSGGAGIPSSILSVMEELSALPVFKNSDWRIQIEKAYKNGIGTGKKQVNLGLLNALFEGDSTNKMDLRTERAIFAELKRQAFPVMLNQAIVRASYFIRQFILQWKETQSLMEYDWNKVFPFRNRTVVRMITVASTTFTAIDVTDAAIRAKIKGGAGFDTKEFILRVNFSGGVNMLVAIGADIKMGIDRQAVSIVISNWTVEKSRAQIQWIRSARSEMEKVAQERLTADVEFFPSALHDMESTMAIMDANGYIQSSNSIVRAFGKHEIFNSVDEFDKLMLGDTPIRL